MEGQKKSGLKDAYKHKMCVNSGNNQNTEASNLFNKFLHFFCRPQLMYKQRHRIDNIH
jgi:predicted ribosome quality control (RQC) complex YloA/Tae2 family protein